MQTLDIYCVLGQQVAASGPQDGTAPRLNLFSDDDYLIRLNALAPVTDATSVNKFNTGTFDFVSFEAALGVVDASPISGQWQMRVVGDNAHPTGQLDAAITPANLQIALNLLPAVIAAGGVNVVQGNTVNVWVVQPVVAGTSLSFEICETNLVPLCLTACKQGANTNGTFTMVKLFKAPYAYTNSFAFGEPPAVQVVMGRVGSSTASCIQYLTIPAGAMGDFDLVYTGFHTPLISTDSPTALTIQTALNSLFADGVTNPRFNISSSVNNVFQILCVGPLANQAVALLGSNMYGQVPLPTPTATWHLGAVPVELAVAGEPSVNMTLCIVGTDSEGNESTLLQQAATVTNRMVTPGMGPQIAAIATVTNTVYQTADPTNDATTIGQMSVSAVLTGSGSAGSTSPYTQGVVHDLNTLTPSVLLFQQTSVSPEKWREMTDTEYNAASADGDPNIVTVSLPFTPPTVGNVGAVKIFCINPLASVNVNNALTLPLTKVYRASDSVTLDVILAGIIASMPTSWPSVPAGVIAGQLSPGQIDLTALSNALQNNAAFLTTLQTLISDSTIIKNIAVALNTSPDFLTTLQSIFSNASNTNLLNAVATAILGNSTFLQGLMPLILAALQGTAPLPNTITIPLPTINWAYPAANADGSYNELPAMQAGATSLGNAQYFVLPASFIGAGKTYNIIAPGFALPSGRKVNAGDLIMSTGNDWYAAIADGGNVYAQDFEKELFTIYLDEDILIPNSKFSVLFQFIFSVLGNCEGHYLFILRRGTPQAASGSSNLTSITWDETIISTEIIGTSVAMPHRFGYTVQRNADSGGSPVLVATKQEEFLDSIADTAPTSPKLVIQALLSHFDTNDMPLPIGQVQVQMAGQTASVVKLS